MLTAVGLSIYLTPLGDQLRSWVHSSQHGDGPGPPAQRQDRHRGRRRRRRRHRDDDAESSSEGASAALPPAPFEKAFFINADASVERRHFMERQLRASGVPFERWPAVRGGTEVLESHRSYFSRGVERHLRTNHSLTGDISAWGTVATYLSHHTLFEHIVRRWRHNESAAFLILQDDTQLNEGWLQQLHTLIGHVEPEWERLLLVWWGLKRPRDCTEHICVVRPPAGPTDSGPECCGKRFYHGLQAWLVRQRNLQCILRRLADRKIKNIDALLVQCNCPHSFALQPRVMIGAHLDRELGSERAAVNAVWRSRLTNHTLKKAAKRNMRKVQIDARR